MESKTWRDRPGRAVRQRASSISFAMRVYPFSVWGEAIWKLKSRQGAPRGDPPAPNKRDRSTGRHLSAVWCRRSHATTTMIQIIRLAAKWKDWGYLPLAISYGLLYSTHMEGPSCHSTPTSWENAAPAALLPGCPSKIKARSSLRAFKSFHPTRFYHLTTSLCKKKN